MIYRGVIDSLDPIKQGNYVEEYKRLLKDAYAKYEGQIAEHRFGDAESSLRIAETVRECDALARYIGYLTIFTGKIANTNKKQRGQ